MWRVECHCQKGPMKSHERCGSGARLGSGHKERTRGLKLGEVGRQGACTELSLATKEGSASVCDGRNVTSCL